VEPSGRSNSSAHTRAHSGIGVEVGVKVALAVGSGAGFALQAEFKSAIVNRKTGKCIFNIELPFRMKIW
jgi:hypothetical protein